MGVQDFNNVSLPSSDAKLSQEFLASHTEKLKGYKNAKDAYVLSTMETAHYKLINKDMEGCKAAIDECEKALEQLSGVETIINASFYRVAADYYKVKKFGGDGSGGEGENKGV